MSSRPLLKPFALVNGTTMGASITSSPVIINQIPGVSFDLSWTGSPTGTFSVEVSNSVVLNPDGSVKTAGNWNTLSLSSSVAASGSAGNGFIDIGDTSAYAVRLIYTRTSGTGALTAIIAGKVL